jgi:hypothetical protein
MRTRNVVALTMACFVSLTTEATSRSLSGQLDGLVTREGLSALDPSQAFVPILIRTAIRAADFPTTANTPDFSYRYNFETGALERTAKTMGSVFLERADTVGRGGIEVGASVFWSDSDQQDGDDLTGVVSTFSLFSPTGPVPVDLRFNSFQLQTVGVTLSGTYGITSDWDVNAVLPVLWTSLEVDATREARLGGTPIPVEVARIDDDRLGIGDLQLRTKYHLPAFRGVDLAAGFVLRLPTGDANDFQGLGDFTTTPLLVGAHDTERWSLYGNIGMEVNASELIRSRVRYGAGVALRPFDRLALLIDVFGSSGISDEEFTAGELTLVTSSSPGERPSHRTIELTATAPRTDIVDAAIGVKVRVLHGVTTFLSVVLPVTTDGLRPDFVPVGGIELAF